MKIRIKKLSNLIVLALLVSNVFCSFLFIAYAADAPPSIEFSFDDEAEDTPAEDTAESDAPPSLGNDPAPTPTPDPTPTPTPTPTPGNTGSGGSTTKRIVQSGPEMLILIPASLILGYALSRKKKKL